MNACDNGRRWEGIVRVFLHGLDSSSRGTKGSFFRERFPEVLLPDFTGSLEQRMEQLEEFLGKRRNLILVGSSLGGLMAALYALRHEERIRRLILLAPALGLVDEGTFAGRRLAVETIIYLGRGDTLVLAGPTARLAGRVFRDPQVHLVEDDHNLHNVFPNLQWDRLLEIAQPEGIR